MGFEVWEQTFGVSYGDAMVVALALGLLLGAIAWLFDWDLWRPAHDRD